MKSFELEIERKNFDTIARPLLETHFGGFTLLRELETGAPVRVRIYTEHAGFIRRISQAFNGANFGEVTTATGCTIRK